MPFYRSTNCTRLILTLRSSVDALNDTSNACQLGSATTIDDIGGRPPIRMTRLNVLSLARVPIFDQLRIEEALFRVHHENWFIWNQNTSPSSIVLGISGKPDQLVHLDRAER